MRKCFFLAAVCLMTNAYSLDWEGLGNQRFGGEVVKEVASNGSVSLKGTQVEGDVRVNGALEAGGASMNSLIVNGSAILRECTIRGQTIINGALLGEHTKFNTIELTGQGLKLIGCEVQSIVLHKMPNFTGTQVIDLTGNNRVNGKITVDSGTGEVWITKGTPFDKSLLTGATIIEK